MITSDKPLIAINSRLVGKQETSHQSGQFRFVRQPFGFRVR